jgi:ubiquinone/menaquinone biosynthesis C-methylase UbiE
VKPEWIARQSRRPSGWIGEVVARVMSVETRAVNAFALSRLPVEAGDAVLEVGCGHGRTLAQLADRVRDGLVAGVDPSDVMVRLATRRLRSAIERGRASVHTAEAQRMPFEDDCFDAVLAVHVLYFWSRPDAELCEIRRVLRTDGVLVLGFRPDGPATRASVPESIYHLRTVDEAEKLLVEAGFEVEEVADGPSTFVCVSARARKPDRGSSRAMRA